MWTKTSYLLGPLDDQEERHKIIVEPARTVFEDWLDRTADADEEDAPFTSEVVKLLLDESRRILHGPGHRSDHLPLLQHALLRIWDAAAERWSRELNRADAPMDLHIGMEDFARIADSDSVNHGSNPGPPARQSDLRGDISRCVRTRDIPGLAEQWINARRREWEGRLDRLGEYLKFMENGGDNDGPVD